MNNKVSGHTSEYMTQKELIHEPVVGVEGEVRGGGGGGGGGETSADG